MNILAWIIFGLIVGFITNLIDPQEAQGGIMGTIILGVLGSVLGGFLGSLFFSLGVAGINFSALIIAVFGALIILILQRAFLGKI